MFKITIPAPCHQDWNSMSVNDQGRHCNACSKTVIDFTAMNDDELRNFFLPKIEDKICGRFRSQQLNRQIDLPSDIFQIPMSWWKRFLVASLIVFGMTLFSCNTSIKGDISTKDFIIRDSVTPANVMQSPPSTIVGAFAIPIITSTIEDTRCSVGDVVTVAMSDSLGLTMGKLQVSTPYPDSIILSKEEQTQSRDSIIDEPVHLISNPDSIQKENPPGADSTKTKCDSLSIIYS